MLDTLIKNALVIDGTGETPYRAKIGISEGKLVMAPYSTDARVEVDAEGCILCPGFIDVHSHSDALLGKAFLAKAKLSQGITTEIVGNCGYSLFPISRDPKRFQEICELVGILTRDVPKEMKEFVDSDKFFQYVQSKQLYLNVAFMVGHGTLRASVMGLESRRATGPELCRMKELLCSAMEAGAIGLSSGLAYAPGGYADRRELRELVECISRYNGVYATHLRNESDSYIESLTEALETVADTGVHLQLSHQKVCGATNCGKSKHAIEIIDKARRSGQVVAIDIYPYTFAMSTLHATLPIQLLALGENACCRMLRNPHVRERLRREMPTIDGRLRQCGGFSGIQIACAPETPQADGMRISEYAKLRNIDQFEAFFDILQENGWRATAFYHFIQREDMLRFLHYPYAMVGTDGILRSEMELCHPRGFETFPKMLAMALERGIPLQAMVRRMTALPAKQFFLENKGQICTGFDADITILDENILKDSRQKVTDCIRQVFVSGTRVWKDGALTGKTPGTCLKRKK